jgi:hypothetical protein
MKWKNDSKDGKEYNGEGKEEKEGGHYMNKAGKICKMEKADDGSLTEDNLQASLNQLEELSKGDPQTSRKEDLLSKAQDGELSTEERDELFQILGGDGAGQDGGEDPITKSLTSNEGLQRAVDVSDYLREQHDGLVKSLDAVSEEIRKSDTRRNEFDLIMAKAVHDIGYAVQGIGERLGVIESQPARGPKSQGVQGAQGGARPLNKAFAGGGGEDAPPGEEQLNKSEILDTMDAIHRDLIEKGGSKKIGGEDMMNAISRYESTHQLSPAMLKAVKQFRARALN